MANETTKRFRRIDLKTVEKAIADQVTVAGAHLDLEGFCYIKLTRTGPDACFAADVTSQVLKGEEPAGGKMTTAEIEKSFWRKPAMGKWSE